MSDVNDEMKAIAEYAIKSAKERYKLDLDYSEKSISNLEIILEKIPWGFSSRTFDESESGLIYNTAIIWGSYLGEYMRQKWGGIWLLKDSKQILSVRKTDLSPISFVYHKLTGRVNYNVEDYLFETNEMISTSEGIAPPEKYVATTVEEINEKYDIKQDQKRITIDKDLLLAILSIAGIVIIFIVFIVGFIRIKNSGVTAFNLIPAVTSTITNTSTNIPAEVVLLTINTSTVIPQNPTVTMLPTYTPKPSITPRPTRTPLPTPTHTNTPTPTETETPFIPTYTPRKSPTATRITPTETEIPPTEPPTPTDTEIPPPTATEPEPISLISCEVNPSTIQAGYTVILTFSAHFSAPGYGFEASIQADNPGQSSCSGVDNDGDGIATCEGSSGMLPSSTTVKVNFTSSVGDCTATYSSQ